MILLWFGRSFLCAASSIAQKSGPLLPDSLRVRIIHLTVSTPSFRTRSVTLITTLLDSIDYPAEAIRSLYAHRWNLELHFHQIKTLLATDVLCSKSPDLIERELAVGLISHNLLHRF